MPDQLTIEEDIRGFLNKSNRMAGSRNAARDIDIILTYYGFGDSDWPTLQSIGTSFKDLTRQRIEQVIKTYFKDTPKNHYHTPELAANQLNGKDMLTLSEYHELLQQAGLVDDTPNCRGILNLIQDCGYCRNYLIVTPRLEEATRSDFVRYDDLLIVDKKLCDRLKKSINTVRSAPANTGLVQLSEIVSNEDTKHFRRILLLMDDAWTQIEDNQFWYELDNRRNKLIRYFKKIFQVVESIEIEELVDVIVNAFRAEPAKYSYPSENVIRNYLKSTPHLIEEDSRVRYTADANGLNESEKLVVSYFREIGECDYPDAAAYLKREANLSDATCRKHIMTSPIVFVDKSAGQGHYKYSLIGHQGKTEVTRKPVPSRYQRFKNQLKRLSLKEGTDRTQKGTSRREQPTLQKWLFEGKQKESCGICGKLLPVSALVTAHKKKRSDCTDEERLDPHIVMPMCKLGCDYLYETKLLRIKDGKVLAMKNEVDNETIFSYLDSIDGRDVSTEWLEGKDEYFE